MSVFCSFRVERTDAGFAELDVTVTSPLGGELPLEIKRVAKEWGEVDLVEFMPEAAGKKLSDKAHNRCSSIGIKFPSNGADEILSFIKWKLY